MSTQTAAPDVGPPYRAVVCKQYGPFEDLELQRLPRQGIGPTHVRIAVAYAGVSFAQSLVVEGLYQRKPPLPFTPGTEISGQVIEIGRDVTRFAVGDSVCAVLDWGGYAEEVIAEEVGVFKIPEGLPLGPAVALPISYGTAYGALLWRARLESSETALIYGAAGGVGLAAAEIATAVGARVIPVVTGDRKEELLRSRGFSTVVNAAKGDIRRAVHEKTNGEGVDVVFDPIGGEATNVGLRCLSDDGRLLTIGYASGDIPKIPANILLLKNISVMGFNWGQYVGWGKVDERQKYGDRVRSAMQTLIHWWENGHIKPSIHGVFPLAEFVKAMDEVKGRKAMGRVVLEPKR